MPKSNSYLSLFVGSIMAITDTRSPSCPRSQPHWKLPPSDHQLAKRSNLQTGAVLPLSAHPLPSQVLGKVALDSARQALSKNHSWTRPLPSRSGSFADEAYDSSSTLALHTQHCFAKTCIVALPTSSNLASSKNRKSCPSCKRHQTCIGSSESFVHHNGQ